MFLSVVCLWQAKRGKKQIWDFFRVFHRSCQVSVTARRAFLIILVDAADWWGWQNCLIPNLKRKILKKKLNSNASINIQRVTRLGSGTDASSEQERPSLNMPIGSRRSVSVIPCWTPAPHQSTAESQDSATWRTAQLGETQKEMLT